MITGQLIISSLAVKRQADDSLPGRPPLSGYHDDDLLAADLTHVIAFIWRHTPPDDMADSVRGELFLVFSLSPALSTRDDDDNSHLWGQGQRRG